MQAKELDDFELWIAGMIIDDVPKEIIEVAKKNDEHRETVLESVCHKFCLRRDGVEVRKAFNHVIDHYDDVCKQLEG